MKISKISWALNEKWENKNKKESNLIEHWSHIIQTKKIIYNFMQQMKQKFVPKKAAAKMRSDHYESQEFSQHLNHLWSFFPKRFFWRECSLWKNYWRHLIKSAESIDKSLCLPLIRIGWEYGVILSPFHLRYLIIIDMIAIVCYCIAHCSLNWNYWHNWVHGLMW